VGAAAVLPADDDPVAAGAATALGGPLGRHARLGGRRFWTPVRWLVLLTLLTSLLGFWQKSPCRVHPWTEQYQYTRGCYSDVFALYFAERLNDGATPYLDHPVEYPVVIGGLMQLGASAVEVFPEDQRPRRFYDLTWAILTGFAVVVTLTTARLAGRRPWDAAMFAAAPLLVLVGTINWDLAAMGLAGLALVQWSRRRPLAAGLLLGAATATKLYPVLFLLPLLALCWRAGRVRLWAVTAVACVAAAFALSLPVYLTSPSFAEVGGRQTQVATSPLDRLGEQGLAALSPHVSTTTPAGMPVVGVNGAYRFVELNRLRKADWGSLWYALERARGEPLDRAVPGQPPAVLNALVAVLFVGALVGIVVLALRAPCRPRLMSLLFLTVLVFLLTSKVWSPQFSLWLLPLALLAYPRWRPLLLWQATEALAFFATWYFFLGLDGSGKGIAVGWYVSALLVRDAALAWLAVLVVRGVLRPEHDVVRAGGVDDPAGGMLDGAGDCQRAAVRHVTASG
jgi:uncharacterized membrane protein